MSAPTAALQPNGVSKAKKESTALLTVKLTAKELDMLTQLASDQLFRREFIDPKMPGNRTDSGETRAGKELVSRLKAIADASAGRKTVPSK